MDRGKIKRDTGKIMKLEPRVREFEDAMRLKAQMESLKSKLGGLEPEKINEKLLYLENRKKELEEEIDKITRKIGELNQRSKDRRLAIIELKKARGKCPVCGRELTEEHKADLLRKYSLELSSIEKEIQEAKALERQLRAEFRKVENELSRLSSLKTIADQIIEIRERLSKINLEDLKRDKEEYELLKSESNKLKGEVESLKKEVNELNDYKNESTKLEIEIDKAKKELSEIEDRLLRLGFKTIDELSGRIRELEKFHNKYIEAKTLRRS